MKPGYVVNRDVMFCPIIVLILMTHYIGALFLAADPIINAIVGIGTKRRHESTEEIRMPARGS